MEKAAEFLPASTAGLGLDAAAYASDGPNMAYENARNGAVTHYKRVRVKSRSLSRQAIGDRALNANAARPRKHPNESKAGPWSAATNRSGSWGAHRNEHIRSMTMGPVAGRRLTHAVLPNQTIVETQQLQKENEHGV
jgi:hypothetical protein